MKTTIRIEDALFEELRERAHCERTSLTRLMERLLWKGLESDRKPPRRRRYKHRTYSMGQPLVNLDKALSLAADLDDLEVIAKLRQGGHFLDLRWENPLLTP